MKPVSLLILLALVSLPAVARDRDGTESHGGDEIGLQFQQALQSSLREIQNGMPDLQAKIAGAKLAAVAEKASVVVVDTPLKVTVDGLEQESVAVNNAAKNQILINRARWKNVLNYRTREGIALHEVASLAKLESTGAYPISGSYVAKFNVAPSALYSVARGAEYVNGTSVCPEPSPAAKEFFALIANPKSTVEDMRNLIENSVVAVDALNDQCETGLLFAIRLRRNEIFNYLYDLYGRPNLNVKSSSRVNHTVYQYALFYAQADMIEQLRQAGGKLENGGYSEFFYVAERNTVDVVDGFVKKGARFDEVLGYLTPFDRAAQFNTKEVIEYLLKAGARADGKWALLNAAQSNTKEAVQTLIRHGARVNPLITKDDLYSPLMMAAQYNLKPEVTAVLIQAGALVNAQDGRYTPGHRYADSAMSPLMFAAKTNSIEVIRVLLQAGADVNLRSLRQKSDNGLDRYRAWDYAVDANRPQAILDLLKPTP